MINVAPRIDKLEANTPFMWRILLITGIGWMFDAMDQGMVSGVMAAIGKEWALTTTQTGWLASIGMLGMALGAAVSGTIADRFGRRTVIMYTLIIFGVASFLAGCSVNYPMLCVFRFLTGFGLGGELPAASTLISEMSPTKVRGRNVIFLESFWAWGWILAALVAYLLIPVYGWRMAFWVGAIPALFAAYIRKGIPESPRFLEKQGRLEEADAIVRKFEEQKGITYKHDAAAIQAVPPAKKINFFDLWGPKYLRSTIVLWIIWFGINFGYYGFVLWTPSLLVAKGFPLVRGFEFTLIMCLAQLPGYFSAAYLVEKVGRKVVLSVYFAGTALAAYLFGQGATEGQILLYGCLLYFFALGAWGCVYAYSPEVYPTVARASGQGWAAAFGRLGAFTAPMVVPVVYNAYGQEAGFGLVFGMMAAVFVVVAIVVALLGKETMGKSLEEVTGELTP